MTATINMTPDVAGEVVKKLREILEGDNGLALVEIEVRAGDKLGRKDAPTDEVEVYANYEGMNLIGGDGNR